MFRFLPKRFRDLCILGLMNDSNQAYVEDEVQNASLQGVATGSSIDTKDDDMAMTSSRSESPDSEQIIEPIIVQSRASANETLREPRRTSGTMVVHFDGVTIKDSKSSPSGAKDITGIYQRNELWKDSDEINENTEQDGASSGSPSEEKAPSSRTGSPQRKTSAHLSQDIQKGDGFPWDQPRKGSYCSIDATSVTMHDSRRPSAMSVKTDPNSRKARFKRWWNNLNRKLQDNRYQSPEGMEELRLLNQMQDTHFGLGKKVMNVVFIIAGIILLLAVIVLIIYTDPQFNESMKALTVFLAGRRQGIW